MIGKKLLNVIKEKVLATHRPSQIIREIDKKYRLAVRMADDNLIKNIELKKGEGTLAVNKYEDGIIISYGCIDDYASKELSTDDLMKILGYEIKERTDMKMMVLDKNDKWKEHEKKVNEESEELVEAIKEKDAAHIAEEALDNIQVNIGILDKLYHEGVDIEDAVHTHNKKLVDRGWKHKAVVKVQVNKM